jgi:type I restriction enzyme S subunit
MAATATPEQIRRFTLRAGDVLITKDSESWTDIAVPAVVAEDLPGVLCGYHLAHIRPEPGCIGAFLGRAFAAIGPRDQFQIAANGITRFGLGGDAIRTGVFAIPPETEQRAIAAFLDRETAKIDVLIAKKERLIELLQEKRTELIARAVTRSLNPNVPMKDSGVKWLGEIPAHWHLRKLKHVCERVFVGVAEAATFAYVDDGVPMLRSTDVRANRIRTDDIRCIDRRFADRLPSKQLRTSDIVTVRTGNAGVSAVVPTEYDGGQCFTLVVSRPAGGHDSRYFCYWLNAPPGQQQFAVEGMGTAQVNISVPIVQNTIVCVPPPEEQERVADWIEQEVARWDALMRKIRDAIDRLKELRTALISAAVTGKIDVRGDVA